jgi:hypothetical protein
MIGEWSCYRHVDGCPYPDDEPDESKSCCLKKRGSDGILYAFFISKFTYTKKRAKRVKQKTAGTLVVQINLAATWDSAQIYTGERFWSFRYAGRS